MYLSEFGYSELVQRLFEKMTFFLVDPLPQAGNHLPETVAGTAVFDPMQGVGPVVG
jgi:hypothetical protein